MAVIHKSTLAALALIIAQRANTHTMGVLDSTTIAKTPKCLG
jgi:hypothetical protein